MERSHGEEGVYGKCRKVKGNDLWYRPGRLAEFRQKPMHCLSYRSRQQQYLLQWLQTLGIKEMQRSTTTDTKSYYRCEYRQLTE